MNPRLPSVLLAGALCAASLPPARAAAVPKDRCDMKAVEAAKKGVAGLGALDQRTVKKYFKHEEKKGYTVHADSQICGEDKKLVAFVREAGKSFGGWENLTLEKQAEHLGRANGWYKTLEERAEALKPKVSDLLQEAFALGVYDDADGTVPPPAEVVAHQERTFDMKGANEVLAKAVRQFYEEIPASGDEGGDPGPTVKAYLAARDALAAHLADVGRYAGGGAGAGIDFALMERMDADLAKEVRTKHAEPAEAGRKAFIAFVRSGEAKKGHPKCGGACDTVAKWLAALKSDAKGAEVAAGREAKEAAGEAEGAAGKAAQAKALADLIAAHPELAGHKGVERHLPDLTERGWKFKELEDGTGAAVFMPLVDDPFGGKLNVGDDGFLSTCGAHSACMPVNEIPWVSGRAPGGAASAAESGAHSKPGAPAAGKKEEPKTGGAETPVRGKDAAKSASDAEKDAALEAQREANTLTLYADSDCRNDGTGEAYRFCPWVKAAFQKLSAERGAKTRFRFLFSDAGKDAEWRALYDSLNIDAPALVYREHGQIKAMRAPHFPDAGTTETRIADFASALDAGRYEPGIPGRRVRPRVEPPAPCSGRGCGGSAPAPCGRGVPCGRGRGRGSAGGSACRPGQPCYAGGAPAAPAVAEERAPAPTRVEAPRAAPAAKPAGAGESCTIWTGAKEVRGQSWCRACRDLAPYEDRLRARCQINEMSSRDPRKYDNPCNSLPCLVAGGQVYPYPASLRKVAEIAR